MPAVDIDRETAAEAAQRELAKPIYQHKSALDSAFDWLLGKLDELLFRAGDVPGGWFTVLVTALIVIAGVTLLIRIARRSARSGGGDFGLFDSRNMTSAEHRAAAQRHAAEGAWSAAIRHRVRAIARQLEERAILTPLPGRTANELAAAAGLELPSLSREFLSCAEIFNDVSYGEQPGTEPGYRLVAGLDEHIRDVRVLAESPAAPASHENWATIK
jgi:hypothetical protein